MCVLIIEDSPEVARLLAMAVAPHAEVLAVIKGFERVITDTDWDSVDAVVVDKHLDDYDGQEILKWLALHKPRVLRIMLTADISTTPAESFAHYLLNKPVSIPLLLHVLGVS